MRMGRKLKRLIRNVVTFVLVFSMVVPVLASDIKDLQDQEQELQGQKQEAEAEKEALLARVEKLTASMKATSEKLDKKKDEIAAAEQELIMAQIEEMEQYASMKLRIQYMYESGNVSLIQIFMESESISDFLSRAEYVMMMSKYDREKLNEFQDAVEDVKEKETLLQNEYDELAELQDSFAEQKAEAEELLSQKMSEIDDLDSQISDMQDQIAKAEEAERKRQEAEEAEKNRQEAEEAEKNQQSGSSSGNSSSSGSSTGQTSKPPVVSGSGYFTHPCPGMSYQSSYFGEIRYGIGDTRPHSGHDYAAAEGTPIYAAAAGTVIIAGYSYSAGYWVVINHGNGLTSKYMHMFEMPYVSVGETVVKGQHIGGVGTTGQSTGNHLHFQVEEYGVAVNPSKYL